MWQNIKVNSKFIIRSVLTIAAFALIGVVAKPKQVIAYLANINAALLLGIIVLKFFSELFKIRKWMLLARVGVPDFSFWAAWRSFYIGLLLATITPSSIGELGRGAVASRINKVELSGLVIVDKMFDLATVALFSVLGVAVIMRQPIVVIGAVGFYLIGLIYLKQIPTLLEKLGFFKLKFLPIDFVKALTSGLRVLPTSLTLRVCILSLTYFTLFYLQTYLIMVAHEIYVPLEAVCYFPLITLSTILPISISGLGVREGTAILLLRTLGIPEAVAFSTFFLHFIISNVLGGLLGAILLLLPWQETG